LGVRLLRGKCLRRSSFDSGKSGILRSAHKLSGAKIVFPSSYCVVLML
jgi:hypothetical protein